MPAESEGLPTTTTIYRAADSRDLMEAKCMTLEPFTDVQRTGMNKVVAAGLLGGAETTVLCALPGFSLTHAWFKAEYPLPLHSHDSHCLYYVIAGSLRLGTEVLGARDSFFVPAQTPYTYRPGAEGVEVLEIRHATHFNFLNLAKGAAFWDRAADTVAAKQDAWRVAMPPARTREESST